MLFAELNSSKRTFLWFLRKSDRIIRNIKNNLKPDSIGLQATSSCTHPRNNPGLVFIVGGYLKKARCTCEECDEPGRVGNGAGLQRASKFDGAQGIMVKPGLCLEVGHELKQILPAYG